MEIDRRELLTGLAVVAVAGIVPALPIRAAVPPLRRFDFNWRPTYSCWRLHEDTAAAVRALRNSVWLYDIDQQRPAIVPARWSIRHLASGLTFRQSLPLMRTSAMLDLDCIETRSSFIPSYDEIHPVGYAAYEVVTAVKALERNQAVSFASNTGAILIRYADCEPDHPLDSPFPLSFEDAEPLPRIESFTDGNV
jgi:hypothetical protein